MGVAMLKQRKYSLAHYMQSIVSQILQHPNNEGQRIQALGRAVGWQLYKNIIRKPINLHAYGGMIIRCYPDSASASNLIYFGQFYDPDEMRFLVDYLRPGDAFIDGGANIGTYSLLATSLVGPDGIIDAFEPDAIAASRLRENVSLNNLSQVRVHEVAITDHDGAVAITLDRDVSNRVAPEQRATNTVVVRCVALDTYLDNARYAMAKLDLEGAEVGAIRGAEHHLLDSNPPVWQIELSLNQLRKMGTDHDELLTLVRDSGYGLYIYDRPKLLTPFRGDRGNFLAIARDHLSEVKERINLPPQ